jgi:hypothetical protein
MASSGNLKRSSEKLPSDEVVPDLSQEADRRLTTVKPVKGGASFCGEGVEVSSWKELLRRNCLRKMPEMQAVEMI